MCVSVHAPFAVFSTVSLSIRGGFRSHRQNTQRVDCVYTTRPNATHLLLGQNFMFGN